MSKNNYWQPFVSVAILYKNKVLALKREKGRYYGGKYDLPGGKIEYGESPLKAALREVKEETNLNIKKENLKLKEVIYWKDDEKGKVRHAICPCFVVELKEDPTKLIKLSNEHIKFEWVIEDSDLIDDFIKKIIRACLM